MLQSLVKSCYNLPNKVGFLIRENCYCNRPVSVVDVVVNAFKTIAP